ncbi:Composite domain of metallo-dependent hydrolase [Mycena venus]|uniref:Composite domain of metallo-dependent hydrolase n=1 Tax=Mycena venus TaxID=2733690 RepID=A0A8H7CKQ2_9AGAR|nr:Composite domain of metallo-dependent hydrolase [Mycena venus]
MVGETRAKLGRRAVLVLGFLVLLKTHLSFLPTSFSKRQIHSIPHQCLSLNTPLEPLPDFTASRTRTGSDHFIPGTRPTLLKNAKILTGARNGTEVIFGDVLLDKGVVVAVGYIPEHFVFPDNVQVIDAQGKWISPGLVDAHSHLGVQPAPALAGARDGNSRKAPILPWLRSIDGINTHDDAYKLAIAGGVTTAQILPGSANNIGGQAFLIKLRPTTERSTSAMILEPPQTLFLNTSTRPTWRHMKHACGENPDRLYGQTRMDAAWNFRNAYNEARKIRDAQDAFCASAQVGKWDGHSAFPESLQWEALVDVLRGRVKLSVHCYEAVDLDALVRLSNEFKFPIASIHHAGETYLVPDLLKRAWGNLPAIALFASNFRKKREAYRGSEFAPRILADNGLPVIMKSDHPVLNSRYLLYEAQQAHYHSLNTGLAIASVTSTPAKALGVGWRVGTIAEGYDADLVLWDSHPLALGATPVQVFIDGIPQLHNASVSFKPDAFQHVPQTPSWEKEIRDTIAFEGLPPLVGRRATGTVAFVGVRSAWVRRDGGIRPLAFADSGVGEKNLTVIVHGGRVACAGPSIAGACAEFISAASGTEIVDLKGGALTPGLTTFGSNLGLSEILLEASTADGPVFDPLTMAVPSILGHAVVRAVDGLQFGGRNTLYAYRAGVTTAIVAPIGTGFLQGVGTAFDVGATHALAAGAIVQAETSLHISLRSGMRASVSTQIATLRRLLFDNEAEGPWMRVRRGRIPLVVRVDNADIMASLLRLKREYEDSTPYTLMMTFTGATEAHLLAAEIGAAGVSVILSPARPYPSNWDSRRVLPGPPLSSETATTTLLQYGVNVGLGVSADYDARNARFEMAWAALDANGSIDYATALAICSTNIEKALGVNTQAKDGDELVVFQGGDIFDFESKVIGVVSAKKTTVEFF